jgi:hypothetical protein
MKVFLLLATLFVFDSFGVPKEMNGIFSGRIAKVNRPASLLRVKVDFENMKYINKKDKVSFWDERQPELQCQAHVLGKSNNYLLLKIPEIRRCAQVVALTPGMYYRFFSQDLVNNLKMGRELVDILVKKKLALGGSLSRKKKELDNHIEKVNAVNMRYKLLRDKLEAEWRDEIAALEEDRLTTVKEYKDVEARLLDAEHKLEKYRIEDENLHEDRWSLDPRLYYKK